MSDHDALQALWCIRPGITVGRRMAFLLHHHARTDQGILPRADPVRGRLRGGKHLPRIHDLSLDDHRRASLQLLHRTLRPVEDEILFHASARLVDRGLKFLEQIHPRLEVGIHLRRRRFGHRPDRREVRAQLDEGCHDHVELRPHRLGGVGRNLHALRRNPEQDARLIAPGRQLLAQQRARAGARGIEAWTGLGHGPQDKKAIGSRLSGENPDSDSRYPIANSRLSFRPLTSGIPVVPKDTLTVVDNRTGKSYELPIQDGTVRAADLRQIKAGDDDFGLMSYDPAFMNTAACRSAISFIDGDKGILRYRGYPIEQLAEKSTFLETAYLLLHGELPSAAEL